MCCHLLPIDHSCCYVIVCLCFHINRRVLSCLWGLNRVGVPFPHTQQWDCTKCCPSGFSLAQTLSTVFLVIMFIFMLMLIESTDNLPCSVVSTSLLFFPFTFPFLFSRSSLFFNMKCSMAGFSRPRIVTVRLTTCSYLYLCFCCRGSGDGERKTHQS